ncbi:glycosyl transferase family 1 [Azospirillum brasilense]|uniref:Glycosyl transferase family 1 n=1 Tax=Azospirillum brasilense TaxID=192 RepID=A0A560BQK6_AZOBR|nr:glycosyltransferase [Azospirillum brasilense]TWA74890.1 glycosyl transferase family 1 [Azospirillum brasilense]
MPNDSSRASDLLSSVAARLCGPAGTGEDLKAIADVCEEARAAGLGADPGVMAALDSAVAGVDPILRESALAHISGDLRRFARILDMVEHVLDLAPLEGVNQIYWSMQRQIFLRRMDAATQPDFFINRLFPFYERFLGEVARRLDLRPAPRPAGAPSTGRVVMVTNQLLSAYHQPSRDLLRQAALLQGGAGREVLILNTNMMPDRYHSPFVPPFAAAIEAQLNGEQLIAFEDQRFRLISSVEPGLTSGKLKGFLAAVEAFDPDVVIGFGGSVLLADLLGSARPLLCIPTTTGTPVTLADIALDFGGITPPPEGGRFARAWRPFRLGLSLRADDGAPTAARADFGLSEHAFPCVVIGNRLDAEVGAAFLALLERLLDAIPHAVVLFAGDAGALPGRLAASRHAGRLRSLGWVERMDGLLGLCGLCLNPRRTGGGASAAQALAAGVPILSFPGGDVASVAGPEFLVTDEDALIARAAALAASPERLEQARAAARARFAAVQGEGGDASRLAALLDEAVALHRQRA